MGAPPAVIFDVKKADGWPSFEESEQAVYRRGNDDEQDCRGTDERPAIQGREP